MKIFLNSRNRVATWLYAVLYSLVLVVVFISSILFYFNSRKYLLDSLDSRLKSNLQGMIPYIELDNHKYLNDTYAKDGLSGNTKAGVTDPIYIEEVEKLRNFVNYFDAEYIYTVNFDPDTKQFYFILDTDEATFEYHPDYLGPIHVGKPYELEQQYYDIFYEAYYHPGEFYTFTLTDVYGGHVTGIVALEVNSEVVAILCVDITDVLLVDTRNTYYTTIIISLGIIALSFAFAALVLHKETKVGISLEKEIQTLAYTDSLTGLPNKLGLKKELDTFIQQKKPNSIAAIFIDINNFKEINKTYGYFVGDKVLIEISNFFKSLDVFVSRPHAGSNSANYGGDEFVILLEVLNLGYLEVFVKNIITKFNEFKRQHDLILKHDLSLSIGIALYPEHAKDVDELLQNANKAILDLLEKQKGGFRIYRK